MPNTAISFCQKTAAAKIRVAEMVMVMAMVMADPVRISADVGYLLCTLFHTVARM